MTFGLWLEFRRGHDGHALVGSAHEQLAPRKESWVPDPKFTKPWHGIAREAIEWHPTVDDDVCIGCGTCVTGCSRLVYRFDYTRLKAIVVDPLNCMVGCTTCANTCPTNAITFPPLQVV